MISFKDFDRAIFKHQELSVACDKITEAFKLLDHDNFNFFSLGWTMDLIIDLLRECSGDKYEYISYYIYEIDYGRKGKNCIKEKDGKRVSLCTTKQLYNHIIKNHD